MQILNQANLFPIFSQIYEYYGFKVDVIRHYHSSITTVHQSRYLLNIFNSIYFAQELAIIINFANVGDKEMHFIA